MPRLIDADSIPWFVEGVGDIPVITKQEIDEMPTVEPTLYGYKIEHLALIARVMQKDGVTPERAVEIFTDVQTITLKVIDKINGAVERAFEQVTETRGSGDGKAD